MFDTTNIKLEIEWLRTKGAHTLEDIKNRLAVPLVKKPQSGLDYESEVYFGRCRNFRVVLSEQGLFLYGSLCKYAFGNNYRTLKHHEIERAIEALSIEINAPLKQALVRRLDFGINAEVNLPVPLYLASLEFLKKSTTARIRDTVYYYSASKKLVFYDKYKQLRKKHLINEEIPVNLIRYEISLERLKHFFGKTPLLFGDLCRKEIYDACLKLWIKDLLKVKTGLSTSISIGAFANIKELRKQLLLLGIEKAGGLTEVLNIIDFAWKVGLIESKHQHSYCKRSLLNDYDSCVSTGTRRDLKTRLVKELKRNLLRKAFLNNHH